MKRQHLSSLLLLASVLSLSACGGEKTTTFDKKVEFQSIPSDIKLTNNYFSPSTFNVNVGVGQKVAVDVAAIPDSFAKEATFKSLDETVATVDASGNVTGVKNGSTKIEVSTKDGLRKEVVDVIVSEAVTNANALTILNKIYDNSQKPDFVKDDVLWCHEIVEQNMLRNGIVYNSAKYIEELAYVATNTDTYFYITSEDISVKTENGAPEVAQGTWRFYVDQESYVTYLLHEVGLAKRYIELNTQSYMGQPRINVLLDVLDMFFVAGRSLVSDMMDDAYGTKEMGPSGTVTDCLMNSYSNVKQSHFKVNDEELYSNLELNFEDQKIKNEEEFDIEIPAGTVYNSIDRTEYHFAKDRVNGWNYYSDISYEVDGVPHDRIFTKSTRYDRSFECVYPDLKAYQQVDSIYDL
mgnify:FL=1